MKKVLTILIFLYGVLMWNVTTVQAQMYTDCVIWPGWLTLGEVTSTSIALSWTEAEFNSECGHVREYRLDWAEEDKEYDYTKTVVTPNLYYTITGLKPNTRYKIQLEASDGGHTELYNSLGIVSTGPNYGFAINDVEITSSNYQNIGNIGGVSGTVTYDPSSKTLTLNNASIHHSSTQGYAIENRGNSGMKIKLIGNNTLSNEGVEEVLSILSNTKIMGSGILEINTDDEQSFGIYVGNQVTLSLEEGCTVDVNGMSYGILGGTPVGCILTVNNSTLKVVGPRDGSVSKLHSLNLEGNVKITQPSNVLLFDRSLVYSNNKNIIKEQIIMEPVVDYGFSINGTKVTSKNCKNIPFIGTGKLSYEHSNRTLRFENFNMIPFSGTCLHNESNTGLVLDLVGANVIRIYQDNFSPAVKLERATTIKGSGTLKVLAHTSSNAIEFNSASTLTIEGGCSVKAEGYHAIKGISGSKMVVSNSLVEATGRSSSISGWDSFTMQDVHIKFPEGARFDAAQKGIVASNSILAAGKVIISPVIRSGLFVNGTEITSKNCKTINTISGVSGTVVYDEDSKTLTLENASIVSSSNNPVFNKNLFDLKINLKGQNIIKCTANNTSAICLEANTTITGNGKLKAESTSGNGISFFTPELGSLTISGGCSVEAIGKKGIAGGNSSKIRRLIIDNATVKASGNQDGSIVNCASIKFNGVSIHQPADSRFSSAKEAIVDASGTVVKGAVEIKPSSGYGFSINGVEIDNNNYTNISSMEGVVGTVTYNPSTQTLTLDNAQISSLYENPIHNRNNAGMKINLIGLNSVKNTGNNQAMLLEKSTTIEGSGKLYIRSDGEKDIAVLFNAPGATLTLQDAQIDVSGQEMGIRGGGSSKLVVNNAIIGIYSSKGAVTNFASFTMSGNIEILPSEAKFDGSKKAIVYGSEAEILKNVFFARPMNMSRYITLKIEKDARFKFDLKTDFNYTTIRIVSGDYQDDVWILGSELLLSDHGGADYGGYGVQFPDTVLTVYGDVRMFDCSENEDVEFREIDFSHNTQLEELYCYTNYYLTSLDVSKLTNLKRLECYSAPIKSLDVTKNTKLKILEFGGEFKSIDLSKNTELESLSYSWSDSIKHLDLSKNLKIKNLSLFQTSIKGVDLSKNTELESFSCINNDSIDLLDFNKNPKLKTLRVSYSKNLKTIDLSKNTELEHLQCFKTQVSLLDVSNKPKLKRLECYQNNFTTAVMDDIYCNLPDRTGMEQGIILPVYSIYDPDFNTVVKGTNTNNLLKKNWKVINGYNNILDSTDGTYVCAPISGTIQTQAMEIRLYPNPVDEILYIQTEEDVIEVCVYNTLGEEVFMVKEHVKQLNLSHLPQGSYVLKVKTAKNFSMWNMIKN